MGGVENRVAEMAKRSDEARDCFLTGLYGPIVEWRRRRPPPTANFRSACRPGDAIVFDVFRTCYFVGGRFPSGKNTREFGWHPKSFRVACPTSAMPGSSPRYRLRPEPPRDSLPLRNRAPKTNPSARDQHPAAGTELPPVAFL